ncbi:MAG: tRNA (guanosine(37)-N1)-methyltransferase TrmD [Bacteroidota bacterium]|nr:tRNA (guanosine(37)-N1)-methyltransferase TrmD [Bacteroidota bacterium]
MHIDILSLVPDLLESPFNHSIIKRAKDKNLVSINICNIRDYAEGKHRQADDTQFGGGAGMVMMAEPIAKCIDHLKAEREYDDIILMTPDGELFNQSTANTFSLKKNLLIICGHYKGIDERIRQTYITKEISIGDYVITGGELAAAIVTDAIVRLIPGVIGDEQSALEDSFQDGLLSPPVYTRPAVWRGIGVPEVLLSGHTANIENWRHEQAIERTKLRRPEMMKD